jgi:hypothetical protein
MSPEEGETRSDGKVAGDDAIEETGSNGKTTDKTTATEKRETTEEERQRRTRITEHARTMLGNIGTRGHSSKK